MPSRSYNPLFIYGGVGMGKTHLMHAIGRSLLDNFGRHAHRLHLQRALHERDDRLHQERSACTQFHQHYRSADVLLIDDIQFSAARSAPRKSSSTPSTSCTITRKQIVISSDSPPKELPGLVERLRRVSNGA